MPRSGVFAFSFHLMAFSRFPRSSVLLEACGLQLVAVFPFRAGVYLLSALGLQLSPAFVVQTTTNSNCHPYTKTTIDPIYGEPISY